jgi:hypothetical protein
MESSMEVPQKTKSRTTMQSSGATLGTHLKECESGYNRGPCPPVFIAALFTIAKLWKQLRCITTDEWINGLYSAIKKNEIMSFAGKGMELEIIMLSEGSQSQKDKAHMFSVICGRQIQKVIGYTNTSIYIYILVCIYIYIYIYVYITCFQ